MNEKRAIAAAGPERAIVQRAAAQLPWHAALYRGAAALAATIQAGLEGLWR